MAIKETVQKINGMIDEIENINISRHTSRWFDEVIVMLGSLEELIGLAMEDENKEERIEAILKLKSLITNMCEALENKDYVLMGDIVSYEIRDAIAPFEG